MAAKEADLAVGEVVLEGAEDADLEVEVGEVAEVVVEVEDLEYKDQQCVLIN